MTTGSSEPVEGRLFQERLRHNPFWMIVACQLVNQTTWLQAEPAFRWMLARYLTPEALADTRPERLHRALRPLGLWRRRSAMLVKFARAWLASPPGTYNEVLGMPGCGCYAADSWAIFVEQRLDVEPEDGMLNWYLRETVR